MKTVDTLLLGAAQVVTVSGGRAGPKRGERAMNDLGVIEDGALAIRRGRIVAIGRSNELAAEYRGMRRIFCRGRTVLPGLVDAHTHPAFARMREDEFAMRCRGADYEEILAAGGGIHASAEALQAAPLEELVRGVSARLDSMLLHGTTAAEAKSGYGLTTESELKSLRAIRSAAHGHPIDVVRTFLGAHVVPKELQTRRSEYIRRIIEEMLPAVVAQRLATFCDVFVERGAFRPKEALEILMAAKSHGLKLKLHVDQFRSGGGAQLAAQVRAVSAEHLDATGRGGIEALARRKVIPVLLPTATLFTGHPQRPDARGMIRAGCAVALATDFNPGTSPTENLSLVASLGCSLLGMTPEEVIAAITRNAAAAIGMESEHGSLAAGRRANLVVIDAPSYTHVPYRMGTNLIRGVMVNGEIVVSRGRRVGIGRR